MHYIGLSSSCFVDMARGKVNPDQVLVVICGTNFESLNRMWKKYRTEYSRSIRADAWNQVAWNLASQFWREGRLVQPRASNNVYPNIAAGRWIAIPDGDYPAQIKQFTIFSKSWVDLFEPKIWLCENHWYENCAYNLELDPSCDNCVYCNQPYERK